MSKLRAFFFIFLFSTGFLLAQLPNGSIAPNFTALDINGQSQSLYDALNDNKIVILEISATWCPPCWSYHQSQALQNFYAAHGPNGDNKARVFWVEGDASTNVDCIYGQAGCNGISSGNFAAGTQYPIINNAAIANTYQISYFPTIFVICPNKRLYEIDPVSAGELWAKAQVCPVSYGVNNAGVFEHDPGYDLPEICGTVDLSPTFKLTNLGSAPLTDANILLKWNNSTIQTINWSGYLGTFGETQIKFDSFQVQDEGVMNTVIASINNNAGDDDFTNNYQNNEFSPAKHFDKLQVVLKIRTDDYAKETYWELRDETGHVLESGGNQLVGPNGGGAFPLGVNVGPGTYPNNALIKDTLNLPEGGCYSIHFVDAYGDGICCNFGNGYYKLYNIDNPATPIIVDGQFGAYDQHAFSAGMLSSETITLDAINFGVELYPNPAADFINLDIETMEASIIDFKVMNSTGQIFLAQQEIALASGENSLGLPLIDLPNGLYFLVLKAKEQPGQIVRKFLVQR